MEDEVTRNVRVPNHVTMTVIQESISLRNLPQSILLSSTHEIWIIEDMGRELYHYSNKGNLIRTIKCWCPIKSAVMTSPSEIVFIDDKAQCIKRVDLTKEDDAAISMLIRQNPHQVPTALCCNREKELVVGVTVDNGTTHRLAIYSNTGSKLLNTLETYTDGDEKIPIFPQPISKVVQNGNGDYIVLCGQQVIAVDTKGYIKWRYSAAQKGKRASRFAVSGIACDKHDHVLISDASNYEIDMLDSDGNFLMCVMTRSKLNDKPLDLEFDNRNNLLLGQADKTIFVVTYLR